ncbi:MAG: RDD family protein [Candidatus Eremiobacteraeota bacterium]|nr:RDD family protein [Candidatus Eremiobacteraeota bacterium]
MEKIRILTPEHIELEYELAGIGSRFVAIVIDLLIQFGICSVLFLAMVISSPDFFDEGIHSIFSSIFASIMFILIMVIFLGGYFILFEIVWSGQTPGKRIAQIQVIKDNGEPVGFIGVLLRNILRIVDFLPAYYILGVVLIIVNKQNKRIGDIVAKTIVVKLKSNLEPVVLPNLKVRSDIDVDITRINEEEYGLIRDFIIRRWDLKPEARFVLAEKISLPLMKKLNVDPADIDIEEFLEVVAVKYRERKKLI